MTIRELRKLKYHGKVEKIKVAEILQVYVQKESKVFKFLIKKDKKKMEGTIDNIENINGIKINSAKTKSQNNG